MKRIVVKQMEKLATCMSLRPPSAALLKEEEAAGALADCRASAGAWADCGAAARKAGCAGARWLTAL